MTSVARVSAQTARRQQIVRHAHGAVLALHTDGVPMLHADWHYDLRRKRLCIYGGLLRFIDVTIAAGRPAMARHVVALLQWYVEDQITPSGDVPKELTDARDVGNARRGLDGLL